MYSNLHKNQQKSSPSLKNKSDIFYSSHYKSQDELYWIQVVHGLTITQKRVLDEFLLLAEKYPTLYPEQRTIASMVGITREHCNRIIKYLVSTGLIHSFYRHMKSCLYTIGDYLKDPGTWIRFKNQFKTFMYRSRRLLLIAAASASSRSDITQYNIIRNYTYTNYPSLIQINFENKQQTPETQHQIRTCTSEASCSCICCEDVFGQTGVVMNEQPTSPQLLALMRKYRFDVSEVSKLEHVPQDVIDYACRVFDKIEPHKLIAPFAYFCGIIKNYKEQPQKRVYHESTGPKDIYRTPEERIYDPVEIANGIVVLKNQEALDKLARLMGIESATKYRDLVLRNWLAKKIEYNETNETHKAAMYYINQHKGAEE